LILLPHSPTSNREFHNPTYSSTTQPSIQYSSHGPRDTPFNSFPPSNTTGEGRGPATPSQGLDQDGGDTIYHMLEDCGAGVPEDKVGMQEASQEGEGEYHLLGEVTQLQGEYSTLGGPEEITYEEPSSLAKVPAKPPVAARRAAKPTYQEHK